MEADQLGDTSMMPFGKHKNYPLWCVPCEHLLMAYENNYVDGALKNYIERNLTKIKMVIAEGAALNASTLYEWNEVQKPFQALPKAALDPGDDNACF